MHSELGSYRKMRVLFDHQIFDAQVHGGISRYFYELLKRFKVSGSEFLLGFTKTQNAYLLEEQSLGLGRSNSNFNRDPFSRGLRFIRRNLPRARRDAYLRNHSVELLDYDLFHPTYYDPYFLEKLKEKPFVLTVYDMIHETFPEQFASHDPVPSFKKQLAIKARRILAISNTTKQDLIRILKLPEEKIVVTHLGVSVPVNDVSGPRSGLLFVGKRGGYKNFDRMLRACAPVMKRYTDIILTCVGGDAFTEEESTNIAGLGLTNRVIQIQASEEQLTRFYDTSLLFIFPSMYEGFGLPLLEAFARGCPVAAARAGSLPEVAGQAARFFDPANEDEMTQVIFALVDSSTARSDLVAKGYERVKEFSWDATSSLTHQIYRSVVDSK
ncbi:MAG: glycosyltransferase family 4 protein [Leptospirales bacterium]|nr:glycosyltransferase family 4 protein [Leptospirales bacterium]